MKETKFFKSAFIYTIGSIFVQGLTFLTLPIFTKIMSPDDFGILASYNFWISIIIILIGLKLDGAVNNALVEYGEDKLDDFSSSTFSICILSFIIMMIITFLFQNILVKLFMIPVEILLLGCIQAFFSFFFTVLIAKYIASKKPWSYLFWAVLNASLNILLSMAFVLQLENDRYLGRVYAALITAIVVGVCCFIISARRSKKFWSKDYLRFGLALTLPLIFHSLSSIVLARSDQLMLLNLVSEYEAGVYSYASNFGHILSVVFNSCNQAFVPWYFIRLKVNDLKSIKEVTNQYMMIAIVLFLGFLCILPEMIKIMGTSEYYGALYSAPLIGLAFYFNYLYMFPVNYEFYHKKTNYISTGTVAAAIINIILNFILIPLFGGIGAALATMFSYMLLLLFHYLLSKYYIKGYELGIKPFIICSLIGIVALLLYYVLLPFIIIRWILAVLLGLSLLALFCIKFRV